MIHWQIALAFLRVGMLGYGGGPSSIPLVRNEVVEKYKWMNDDEFADIVALGNTLPGPIATKMAGYIGYRVAGFFGMINAVAAMIIPTIVLMIILLTSISALKDQAWVIGMTKAVVPVVGVMLAVLTRDFVYKARASLGWRKTMVLTFGSLIVIHFLGIHPGIVIAALLLFSIANPNNKENRNLKSEGGNRV